MTPRELLAAAAAGRWHEALCAWQTTWQGRPPDRAEELRAFVVGAGALGRADVRNTAVDRLVTLGLPGGL